ncbi:glucan 1,3-beta-glucosidase [Stagonosporopsis vannaccii]|nr:glucan 1,3-beta-glucosidase [Stagonosporopsis vannaccii]
MRFAPSVAASAALLSTANAAIKGFNYGAQFNNDAAKTLTDFEYEFNAAKNLPGTDGWTSARLYTMIQHGTQNTVIEAIQAAINTQTTLLLGLWASAGQESFNNEIVALKAAIDQFGTAFTDLVVGISVGSEDLYRISADGAGGNPGTEPSVLVNYIKQTRDAIAGTPLSGAQLGHVDTWQVYVNASNNDVINNLDWVGMDAYPYFQSSFNNGIGSGADLFFDAYNQTVAASQGKPVWVTETGWPVSGETVNQAVPSADNARIYWEDVTCKLVNDNVNLYYYILQDVQWGNPSPSFGIKPGGDLAQVSPLFDLSCPAATKNVSHLPMSIPFSALSPLMIPLSVNTCFVAPLLSSFLLRYCHVARVPRPYFVPAHLLAWAVMPSAWDAWANVETKGTLPVPTAIGSSVVTASTLSSSGEVTWPSTSCDDF